MRKFLLVVVGVVALGLTLRYTLGRSKPGKPAAPAQPAQPAQAVQAAASGSAGSEAPAPVAPEATKPAPRFPGSIEITNAIVGEFVVAPGVVYYCHRHDLFAQPKDGTAAKRIGDCNETFDLVADAGGVFYTLEDRVMRVNAGTVGNEAVVEDFSIVMAVDAEHVYYVRPPFSEVEEPGVYRVARTGGEATRIHDRNKEQFGIHVDRDGLWITGYFSGTIIKVVDGKKTTVVTGQKRLDGFATDDAYMYWTTEKPGELKRRLKTGGPIETLSKDVLTAHFDAVEGHLYWAEWEPGDGKTFRVLHLAPGVQDSEVLATGMQFPRVVADREGVYIAEAHRPGLFWFKR